MIQELTNKALDKFDAKWFGEIETNVQENWLNLTLILIDIPGRDCQQIGSRLAIAVRKLSGIALN